MDKILSRIKRFIPQKLFKVLQPSYHFILSWFSAWIYGFPSESLIVVGVTGTTGKTTSVDLIAKMLNDAGVKTGLTSTAMFNDGKKEWLNDKKMTMIGRFFTQKMLRNMVRNKCVVAIVETTSEGIRQFRHRFINYDIVVFTGLYEEHIESHGSFENYKKAKGELFAHLKKCKVKYADDERQIKRFASSLKKIEMNRIKKTIIANGDDGHADYFLDFWSERKFAYTEDGEKIFKNDIEKLVFENISYSINGICFTVLGTRMDLQLLGLFNVVNAMNAVGVGLALNLEMNVIKKGLEIIEGVPGRLERITEGQNFTVIVDYAFEPNALHKLFETVSHLPHNKIIHVLGATGGGRDISRRPKLGKIAGERADFVVVTNEDPYDDDPAIIIDQVAMGAENAGKIIDKNLFKILERRDAIKKALDLATEKDVVLITGKGSEQAICVGMGEKIPWDDRAVVRGLLNKDKAIDIGLMIK